MQNLTWTEAKEVMRNGGRVKHQYFCRDEWFQMQHGRIVDENGYNMEGWYRDEAWQDENWLVLSEEVESDNHPGDELMLSQQKGYNELKAAKAVLSDVDFGHLETLVAASMMAGTRWETPVSRLENQNKPSARNHKLYKGNGHNKLKKGKKK